MSARGNIVPSYARQIMGADHLPPFPAVDRLGRPWRGSSRIINRPARRNANTRRRTETAAALRVQRLARRRLAEQLRTEAFKQARQDPAALLAAADTLTVTSQATASRRAPRSMRRAAARRKAWQR